uniref:Uncharacterized protein n=1 Tax=Arundo donax TaxID=35708 RepID=A0A0A9FFN8_ARUDO
MASPKPFIALQNATCPKYWLIPTAPVDTAQKTVPIARTAGRS